MRFIQKGLENLVVEVVTNISYVRQLGTTHQILMRSQVSISNLEKSLMQAFFTSSTWASLKRMATQRNENIELKLNKEEVVSKCA